MRNVFIVGCNGKMGQLVYELIQKDECWDSYYGFDLTTSKRNIFVYTSMERLMSDAFTVNDYTNVIVDFSHPSATMEILPFAVEKEIPMVIATTGFTPEQQKEIINCAKTIPIFKSSNMAYSSTAFTRLVKMAASLLQEPYEISIHEIHHKGKKDAPSGTAKDMLFEAVNEGRGNTLKYRFDSNGLKADNEVWVSSERVGHFRGEHTVTIAGPNDFVQLRHFVSDRKVFAEGALQAARFIMEQTEPGLYTMENLFNK